MSESKFSLAQVSEPEKRTVINVRVPSFSYAQEKCYPGAAREERQGVLCGGGNCSHLGRWARRLCAPTKRYNW